MMNEWCITAIVVELVPKQLKMFKLVSVAHFGSQKLFSVAFDPFSTRSWKRVISSIFCAFFCKAQHDLMFLVAIAFAFFIIIVS